MPSPRGLLRTPFRPPPPAPDANSDAELLGRYVADRTEEAFAALVRRHGPMVLGVCRRRLGPTPDADDAFQVTFMLLARDAGRIGSRESLPGWLYRVAYLVALKMSGTRGRRRADPLPDDPADPAPEPAAGAEARELRAALDEELAALPDKLRAVVVLCGLEERSNAEAARLLGCPTGTVDSRLSAARQKLRARLARRGWPVPAVAALDALLRSPPASASGSAVLFDLTARAAVAYAASGGAAADPLSTFANGVTTAMSSVNAKLLIAAGMSLAVFATAGLGLLGAPADDGPKSKPLATAPVAKADLPKKDTEPAKPDEPAAPANLEGANAGRPVLADEASVRTALAQPAPTTLPEISLSDLLELLYTQYGVNARIDGAAFKRLTGNSVAGDEAQPGPTWMREYYNARLHLPITRGMSVADLLTESLAQLPTPTHITYRVRGNQVLIVPAFQPSTPPGSGGVIDPGVIATDVDQRVVLEQVAGEPVSIAVDGKPLDEVLKELRRLTGANIVLDARCREQARMAVSGTFDDVRLFTALTVLADMCELKPAYTNNVYYVTTPENADRLQKQYYYDAYGEPQPPLPPFMPSAGGLGGGFGLFGGGQAAPPTPAPGPGSLGGGVGAPGKPSQPPKP